MLYAPFFFKPIFHLSIGSKHYIWLFTFLIFFHQPPFKMSCHSQSCSTKGHYTLIFALSVTSISHLRFHNTNWLIAPPHVYFLATHSTTEDIGVLISIPTRLSSHAMLYSTSHQNHNVVFSSFYFCKEKKVNRRK